MRLPLVGCRVHAVVRCGVEMSREPMMDLTLCIVLTTGSVAKNILATITSSGKITMATITGMVRKFLRHYMLPDIVGEVSCFSGRIRSVIFAV
jgi:hypothetical protein